MNNGVKVVRYSDLTIKTNSFYFDVKVVIGLGSTYLLRGLGCQHIVEQSPLFIRLMSADM